MIVLYVLLGDIPATRVMSIIAVKSVAVLCVATLMWMLHRRPATMRMGRCKDRFIANLRTSMQATFGVLILFILCKPPHHYWSDIPSAISQLVYVIFYYSTDITSGSKHGRRRKLALAELKKMFGTEWIPKPMLMPQ